MKRKNWRGRVALMTQQMVVAGVVAASSSLLASMARGQEELNSSLYRPIYGSARPVAMSQNVSGGMAGGVGAATSANTSLNQIGGFTPATTTSGSWFEVPVPPPKMVQVNDLVTIRVDMGARAVAQGQMQRRNTARFDVILDDWIKLNGLRSVKPAPQTDGDQHIQTNQNQTFRATGQQESTESLKFELAAKVAAILPNGNLILEAHSKVRHNDELWMISLSGVCTRESIQPGGYVLSKDIADLAIDKREFGHVRDAYKRGFITRMLDTFAPFQ